MVQLQHPGAIWKHEGSEVQGHPPSKSQLWLRGFLKTNPQRPIHRLTTECHFQKGCLRASTVHHWVEKDLFGDGGSVEDTYSHFFLEMVFEEHFILQCCLSVGYLLSSFSPVANRLKLQQAQQGNEIQAQISLCLGT